MDTCPGADSARRRRSSARLIKCARKMDHVLRQLWKASVDSCKRGTRPVGDTRHAGVMSVRGRDDDAHTHDDTIMNVNRKSNSNSSSSDKGRSDVSMRCMCWLRNRLIKSINLLR